MDSRVHWADRPLWVRVRPLGVPSRRAALAWMNGTLAFTLLFLLAIFAVPITVDGVAVGMGARILCAVPFALLALLAPLCYWLALRYADDHAG